MSQFAIEEISDWQQLTPLRQQWNDLVSSQNLPPAHQFDWQATVWEVNRAQKELLVLLLRDGQGLAGIAPFVKETEKRKGLTVSILRPLSWFHSMHGTQLIRGSDSQSLFREIFDYLARKHGHWALWFTQFESGEEQERLFIRELRDRGLSYESYVGERSPYMRLSQTWEEKMKTLQPRFRTALRSREKRLRERGRIELRFLDSLGDLQAGLEAIREIEGDSWKVSAGSAITEQDFQWQFYSRYAPIAALNGTLRIPVLFLDGEPLAYDYALLERGVYYLLKTSYKQKWQEMYPGFVLRKMLVEWMYAQQGSEIDFLGKDEEWKMKWTDSVREHTVCYGYNHNLSALYLRSLHHIGALLRRKG